VFGNALAKLLDELAAGLLQHVHLADQPALAPLMVRQ